MDLIKIVLRTLKNNLRLSIILIAIAICGGVVHYTIQTIRYVSDFKTNNGSVEYDLFRSLTDFKSISAEVYNLPDDEIKAYQTIMEEFKVSFIEETTSSVSFTIVSEDTGDNHDKVQQCVLNLINNNKFIKNAQDNKIRVTEKKLAFLTEKVNLLNKLMLSTNGNSNIGEITADAYNLYSQKVDLEEELREMGKFEIIKPVTEILENKKPILLFLALYLVLGGFLFLLLSKKEKAIDNQKA